MKPVEIDYELKPEDLYRFAREIAPAQTSHKPLVAVLGITHLLFIFSDVLLAWFSGTLREWDLAALLAGVFFRTLISFAVLFIVLGIINLFVKKKAKDILAEPPNGLFCRHRIILTEKELIELTDVNTSRYAWKAIGEIKEYENFIALDVLQSSAYIIPKRHFADQRQIKTFVETANLFRLNAANSFQLSHLIEFEKSLE